MEITLEDFENLFEVAMEWELETWEGQEYRFNFPIEIQSGYIYWVENRASMIMCRQFLNERGFTCIDSWDEATQQWAFISDYNWETSRVGA